MTHPDVCLPARLVVIGIDAASPDLLERWMADGTLPHLAALAARGATARLRGIDGFYIGSTWPSMYTGTNPARHGIHYLLGLVPGTYDLEEVAAGEFVRRPPFWRALQDAGQRVAVLDVPLTRLDLSIAGVQVVEWGGHDSLYGFGTSSTALTAELVERYGTHPVAGSCDGERRTAAEYASFVERLDTGARRKGEWTRALLARGGWDLFMQVFTESHCVGHQCWHLHDASHPGHDPAIARELGDPLRRVYQAIDREVGALATAAGDAPIIVFSAHGMSHWFGAQFLLRDILIRLGAMAPRPAPSAPSQRPGREAARALWRLLPASLRRAAREPLRRVWRAAGLASEQPRRPPEIDADVTRSRCFPHPNGLAVGGIRLNLVGREPHGILQPGAEADDFVGWLEASLLGISDERTGRPLVRRVLRTAALFEGEELARLPDLLVEWSDDVPTGSATIAGGAQATVRASIPAHGSVEATNVYGRTGEHRSGGWLVAAGPRITGGRLAEASLLDLAPTLTAMLGVSLIGSDGRPIGALMGGQNAERD